MCRGCKTFGCIRRGLCINPDCLFWWRKEGNIARFKLQKDNDAGKKPKNRGRKHAEGTWSFEGLEKWKSY